MGIKNWSYKQKNQLLGIAGVLFLLFIYNFVISITMDLAKTNTILTTKVNESVNAPERRKILESKLERFNNSLNKYFIDSLKNREYILGIVSNYCQKHNLILREFPESTLSQEKDFEIETNVIVAEGGYLDLLKLVYEMEQNVKVARPASVNFEKKLDHKRKQDVLTVTIYLQNLKMKNDENEK